MVALTLLAGVALLVLGAELLVRGASRLALAFGITPLVIGLTVVAMGTSAPEVAVSVMAALKGQADISVGNVVGSNIFNVLAILGCSALIAPLIVHSQLIRWDVPILIAVSLILGGMIFDLRISVLESAFLLVLLLAYTLLLLVLSRREGKEIQAEFAQELGDKPPPSLIHRFWDIGLILVGLGMLVLGSQWLVDSSVQIAKSLGVSELIIGLTVVAAGTSLPELATSLVAVYRGERDIAVGNVIGSCIFNITGVLGLSGIVGGAGIEVASAILYFDYPAMLLVTLSCFPIFFVGQQIYRSDGVMFLAAFVLYLAYLTLAAANHPALTVVRNGMVWFFGPTAFLMIFIPFFIALRDRAKNREVP